jgi:hypothetical protein
MENSANKLARPVGATVPACTASNGRATRRATRSRPGGDQTRQRPPVASIRSSRSTSHVTKGWSNGRGHTPQRSNHNGHNAECGGSRANHPFAPRHRPLRCSRAKTSPASMPRVRGATIPYELARSSHRTHLSASTARWSARHRVGQPKGWNTAEVTIPPDCGIA